FDRIERRFSSESGAVLRGTVLAIEEVDRSPTQWDSRLVVELELVNEREDARLWSRRYEIVRPLPERSPAGVAAATSAAVAEIVRKGAPQLAAALGSQPPPSAEEPQSRLFTGSRVEQV